MADSVDRVFAHALSTIRKIPRTGSARPPPAERQRLYGLYKQSMEGDVVGVMTRPVDVRTAEAKAAAEKWDAWHACAGLSRTEAKRRYITTLIRTMHQYAAGTAEARALVEELEFVWEQVRGNYEGQLSADTSPGADRAGRRRGSDERPPSRDPSGLRILRPMSDNDAQSRAADGHELQDDNEDADEAGPLALPSAGHSNSSGGRSARAYSRSPSPDGDGTGLPSGTNADATPGEAAAHWRRRVSRALVQLTAEVAALRELADGSSTSALGRYFARSRRKRRGWLLRAGVLLWRLARRVLVDAAVVALVVVVLRWRYRARVETAWELLGVWLGFVTEEVRGKLREGMREGLRMGQGMGGMIAGRRAGDVSSGGGEGRREGH